MSRRGSGGGSRSGGFSGGSGRSRSPSPSRGSSGFSGGGRSPSSGRVGQTRPASPSRGSGNYGGGNTRNVTNNYYRGGGYGYPGYGYGAGNFLLGSTLGFLGGAALGSAVGGNDTVVVEQPSYPYYPPYGYPPQQPIYYSNGIPYYVPNSPY